MDAVREVGKELIAAKPSELAVGNIVSIQRDINPCPSELVVGDVVRSCDEKIVSN